MYAPGPHSIAGDDDDDYITNGGGGGGRRQQMPLKNNNGGLVAYDLEADEMSDQVLSSPQQHQLHQLHHQKIKSLNRRQQQQQQQQQQHPYYPSGSMSRISNKYDSQQQQQLPRNYYNRPLQYGTVGGGAGRRRSATDRRSSGPSNAVDDNPSAIPTQYRQYRHTLHRPSTSNSDRRLSIDAGSQPTQYNPYVVTDDTHLSPSRISHSRSYDPELRTALKQINSWFDFDNYDEKQLKQHQQLQNRLPFDPRVLVMNNNNNPNDDEGDYNDNEDSDVPGGGGVLRMPAHTVIHHQQQRSRGSIAPPLPVDPSIYRPLSDYATSKFNTHHNINSGISANQLIAGLHNSKSSAQLSSSQHRNNNTTNNNNNKRFNGLRHNTASRSSLSSAYSIGSRGSRPSRVTADGTVTGPGTSTTSLNQSASLQRNIQHQHQRSLNNPVAQQQQFQQRNSSSTLPNHYINNRPLPKRPLDLHQPPLPDPPPPPVHSRAAATGTTLRSNRTNSRLASGGGGGVGVLPTLLSNRSTTGDGCSTTTTTALRQQSLSANSDSPELLKSGGGGTLATATAGTSSSARRNNSQHNFTFIRYRGRKCTTVMLIAFVILVILLTVTPIVYFTSTALRQNNAKKSLTPMIPTSSSLLSDAFVPITVSDTGGSGSDGTLIDPGGGSRARAAGSTEIANITGKLTLLTNIGPLDDVLNYPYENSEKRTDELMKRLQMFMIDVVIQAGAFDETDIKDMEVTADERPLEHELDVNFNVRLKRSLPADDVEPKIKHAFSMAAHEDAGTHIASIAQIPFRKGSLRYSMVPRSSNVDGDSSPPDGGLDGFAVGSANDRVPPAPPPPSSSPPPTATENVEHGSTTQQQPLHVKTASFTIKPSTTGGDSTQHGPHHSHHHTTAVESSTAPSTLRPSLAFNKPFGHTSSIGSSSSGSSRTATTPLPTSHASASSSSKLMPFTPGGHVAPYKPTPPNLPTTPFFTTTTPRTTMTGVQSLGEFAPQQSHDTASSLLAAANGEQKPVTMPGIKPYKPTPPTLPSPTTAAPPFKNAASATASNVVADESTQEVLRFKWMSKDPASEPTFPPPTPEAPTTTTTTTTTTTSVPVPTTLFITKRKPHNVTPLPHLAISTFAPSDVASWQKQTFLPAGPASASTTITTATLSTTTTAAPTITTAATTSTTTTSTTTTTVAPVVPTESAASQRLSNALTTRSSIVSLAMVTPNDFVDGNNSTRTPHFSTHEASPTALTRTPSTTAFPYTAADAEQTGTSHPPRRPFMTTSPTTTKLLWTIPTTTTTNAPFAPAANTGPRFYHQQQQQHNFLTPVITTTTTAKPAYDSFFTPQTKEPSSFATTAVPRTRPPLAPPAPPPPPRWAVPHVLSVPVFQRPLRPLLFNATLTVGGAGVEQSSRFYPPTSQRPSDVAVPDQPWQFGLTAGTTRAQQQLQQTDPASFYSWLSTKFPSPPGSSGASTRSLHQQPLTTSSFFMSTTKPANFQQHASTFGVNGPLTITTTDSSLVPFIPTTLRPIVHESKTHSSESYAWSQWSEWGSCSASPCQQNGFQTRTRICRSWFGMGPPLPEGDGPCLSQNSQVSAAGAVEARPCVCDLDENLAAAGGVGPHGHTIGDAMPLTADGGLSTRDSTPTATLTTAEWSAWSPWSSCFSQPCSPYSTQFRQRKCLDTNTRSEINGLLCRRQGDNSPESMANTETRYCVCPAGAPASELPHGSPSSPPPAAAVVAVVGDNFDNARRDSSSSTNGEEESRRNQPPVLSQNLSRCRDSERQCKSGECIPSFQYCDGFSDCADGSDEPAGCATCFSGEFKCHNGRCISSTSMCDGLDHCGDQSDEHFCSR